MSKRLPFYTKHHPSEIARNLTTTQTAPKAVTCGIGHVIYTASEKRGLSEACMFSSSEVYRR